MTSYSVFLIRLLTFIVIASVIAIFIYATEVFLVAFAAILLAVFLCKCVDKFKQWFDFSHSVSLSITCLILGSITTISSVLLAPVVNSQVREIRQTLPAALDRLKEDISHTSWGKELIQETSSADEMFEESEADIISRTTGIFSGTLTVFTNVILILVIGIFQASSPKTYIEGILMFFSGDNRVKAHEVIDNSYNKLGSWLKGKFLSMLIVGVLSYIGLSFLDMPFAIVLALIALCFSFIPNVGPILALIPAVLLALLESTDKALYVLILYFSIQIVESYFITPFIEKNTVSVPPALSLTWLLLIGTLLGGVGLFLAISMLVVIMVIISTIYLPRV